MNEISPKKKLKIAAVSFISLGIIFILIWILGVWVYSNGIFDSFIKNTSTYIQYENIVQSKKTEIMVLRSKATTDLENRLLDSLEIVIESQGISIKNSATFNYMLFVKMVGSQGLILMVIGCWFFKFYRMA